MLEIVHQKYMKILFEIKKNPKNQTVLAKKCDITAATLSNLINRWVREGVLTKKKVEGGRGNDMNVILTEYAEEQVSLLKKMWTNHKNHKNNLNKMEEENGSK